MKIGCSALCALSLSAFLGAQGPGMISYTSENGYVQVQHSPDLVPANTLTVEAWVLHDPAAPGGSNRPSIIRKSQWSHSYVLVKHNGVNAALEFIVSTSAAGLNILYSPGPIPTNTWFHVAGVYDGAMMRMYFDGVLVSSMPASGTINGDTDILQLGQGGSSSETWRGKLDEIRIWSVARSASQIQSTMFKRVDNKPGLVAAWHFDGNYADLTGGHNGVAIGPGISIVPSTSPVRAIYLDAAPSAPIGTTIGYELFTLPPSTPFLMDVSLSGSTPGVVLPAPLTGSFPLNPPFLNSTYGAVIPNVFVGFAGITNGMGLAFPSVNLPAVPQLIGQSLSAAFFVIDGLAPYGVGAISNAVSTSVTAPPPVVTSVSPATGPTAGGWPVTINGSNFLPGATVRFNGTAATNASVITSSTITCSTPAGSLGAASVQVSNPDGNSFTLPGAFTYVPTLAITTVSPLVAPPGAVVAIVGQGIQAGATISISGIPVTVTAQTATSMTFVMPPGVPCSATLTVTNPDGQTRTTPFNPSPTILSLINGSGPVAGGGTVLIIGAQFVVGTTVTIGGNPAAIQALTASTILVGVPAGSAPGPVPLVVTSTSGCSATGTYVYF